VFFCGALHAGWGDFLESSGGAGNEKDARQVSGGVCRKEKLSAQVRWPCVMVFALQFSFGSSALAGRPQHNAIPKRTPTNQTRGQGSFSFIFSLRASLSSVGIPSWREVFDWNLKELFTM
jgi:hypothetical protein